jgi:hypothetical protein
VFDRIQRLLTFLQVRVLYTTNVQTFLTHIPTFCTHILQNVRNALCTSVKKNTQEEAPRAEKGPRTEQDERFLTLVSQIMKAERITSERAFSLEFGRGPDFISRIRRGIQSAPADAWDALLNKYPEARNITTTNVMAQGGGQAVGTVQGDNLYAPTTLEGCQVELEQHKRDLASARAEIEQLKQQVAAKDALLASQEVVIASKEEIISLLRGGYNRPN